MVITKKKDKAVNDLVSQELVSQELITIIDAGKSQIITQINFNNKPTQKIICKKNSSLKLYILNSSSSNNSLTVELEDNANMELINLSILNKKESNQNLKIIHKGANTISNLHNKAILSNSNAQIKGLISIQKNAKESQGYQKTDFLILDDSRAISIPDLEICNNDVKCTHSSSITRIDREKIFYLQTRGIEKKEAFALMINAFIDESLSKFANNIDDKIMNDIQQKIFAMESKI